MRINLSVAPQSGSFQAKFEEIMRLIGWSRGALAISDCGDYYLNQDANRHWDAFLQNIIG